MKKILLSILTILVLVGCKSSTERVETKFTETVIAEDLVIGEKYEFIGYLTYSGTNKVYLDADGSPVTAATGEFVADKSKVEKEMTFEFNGSNAIGKKLKAHYELIKR